MRVNKEIFSQEIPRSIFSDSKCVLDGCVTFHPTANLRHLSEIFVVRDSLARYEVEEIKWIDTKLSPADGLTKSPFTARKDNGVLTRCLSIGYLDTSVRASITRNASQFGSRSDFSLG